MISDKIGRKATLLIMLTFQGVLMLIAIPSWERHFKRDSDRDSGHLLDSTMEPTSPLFPSLTKDSWGLKNFGINYGLVSRHGCGRVVMGRLSQMLYASSGSYTSSSSPRVLLFAGPSSPSPCKGKKPMMRLRR